MDSNITINIVEPGSTPVDPVVPNTGLFTSGIGGPEATIIGIVAVVILAAILAVLYYRKKKQGKMGGLLAIYKQTLKHKKSTTISLFILSLLVSIGTVAGLIKLSANADELTATVDDADITIELGDEPVLAYIPATITVDNSTDSGYTIKAYSEHSTLSAEGTDKTIDLVTVPEDDLENAGSLTATLTDNTWGLSIEEPESEAQDIYFSLPASADEAVTIATVEDMEAEDSNTTTVYYGVYITPDMPYGTYTGASVDYIVEDNSWATVIYDSNGLYFNGDDTQTTNTMKYTVDITDNTEKISHTPNVDDNGEQIAGEYIHFGTYLNNPVIIPGAAKVHVSLKYGIYDGFFNQNNNEYWAYMTIWQGDKPEYTAADNYNDGIRQCGDMTTTDGRINGHTYDPITVECDIPGDAVTFGFWTQPGGGPSIGYGYYAVATGYDEDGNIIYLSGNTPVRGEYKEPAQDLPYNFLGWNTDKDATAAIYTSAEDIKKNAPLTPGETTTLYAIWQHATNITFNGNGADGGEGMPDRFVAAGAATWLSNTNPDDGQNAYTKTGYVFAGWNTETDGSGTDYTSRYAPFIAPTDKSENLTLYAQWAKPTTISFNGNGADGGSGREDVSLAPGEGTNFCNYNYYTRSGYYFTGWNTEADGSGISYDNCASYTAPAEPVEFTLYAQWQRYTTISFDGNGADGGSGREDVSLAPGEGTNFCNYNYYTRSGYYFTGWNTEADGSGISYDNCAWYTAPYGEFPQFTLYAQWSPATTFIYYGNGADSGEMQNQNIPAGEGDSLWCADGNYFRDGYYSNSWNTDPYGNGASYDCWQWYEASDGPTVITLYAQWSPATTFIFEGNGADWGEMGRENIPAGQTWDLQNNDYHKEGYYFAGWNTESDGTGTPYNNLQSITASDQSTVITLYAQWVPEGEGYYTTISFDGNGADGGEMQDQIVAAGQTAQLCADYWKDGYWFFSWNTDPEGNGTGYTNCGQYTAPAGEITELTLYAIWAEEGAYTTIVYNANGGEGYMDDQTIWAGNTEQLQGDGYSRNGYYFINWNTEPDGTGTSYSAYEYYTASNKFETITLYAQWQRYTTISFDGNGADGGSGMEEVSLAPGNSTNFCNYNYYTRSGYYFTGWNTEADGSGISYDNCASYTAPAEPVEFTLYAQWLPTTTITFNGNDATSGSMSDQVIVAGTPQNLTPNAFTKDGYIFNGWNTEETPTAENPGTAYADKVQYIASTTQPESFTLYAQWKQVFYMQDVAIWGSTLSQGDTMEAVDKRDGQEYTVARLADNKIWMTKNLNLAGGTEITSELSNVPDGYTLPTANGFEDGNKLPASSTSGFNNDTKAFVYNSTKTSGTDCTSPGCYSYYSWAAATAGSGLSITTDDTDAPYSICPKGWKLPNSRSTAASDWQFADFYQLAVAYGMDPSTTSQSTRNFYNRAGPDTTPNFLLTGYYNNGTFINGNSYGEYWSSTSGSSTSVRRLRFSSSYVNSALDSGRRLGNAVRCIAE